MELTKNILKICQFQFLFQLYSIFNQARNFLTTGAEKVTFFSEIFQVLLQKRGTPCNVLSMQYLRITIRNFANCFSTTS